MGNNNDSPPHRLSGTDELFEQQKTNKRALNREAARRTRLKKKLYVQQLESRSANLSKIEKEYKLCRKQGLLLSLGTYGSKHKTDATDYAIYVSDYARWLHDHSKHIQAVQTALNSHASTFDLQKIVHTAIVHFTNFLSLKSKASKVDLCHIIYGMWTSPAERCMQWIGGFRVSNLLTVLLTHMDSLAHQQIKRITQLQQTTYQSEESLSHDMEEMHKSLFQTLAAKTHELPNGESSVENYMGQMSMAIGQFSSLEHFLRQADQLRERTLHDLHQMLTTHQSAQALIHINNYFSRLRAMSTLWVARQHE